MSGFADRKPRTSATCPRCGRRPKAAEVIFQARGLARPRPGALATRARRLCEPCALEVFEAAEAVLDAPAPVREAAS